MLRFSLSSLAARCQVRMARHKVDLYTVTAITSGIILPLIIVQVGLLDNFKHGIICLAPQPPVLCAVYKMPLAAMTTYPGLWLGWLTSICAGISVGLLTHRQIIMPFPAVVSQTTSRNSLVWRRKILIQHADAMQIVQLAALLASALLYLCFTFSLLRFHQHFESLPAYIGNLMFWSGRRYWMMMVGLGGLPWLIVAPLLFFRRLLLAWTAADYRQLLRLANWRFRVEPLCDENRATEGHPYGIEITRAQDRAGVYRAFIAYSDHHDSSVRVYAFERNRQERTSPWHADRNRFEVAQSQLPDPRVGFALGTEPDGTGEVLFVFSKDMVRQWPAGELSQDPIVPDFSLCREVAYWQGTTIFTDQKDERLFCLHDGRRLYSWRPGNRDVSLLHEVCDEIHGIAYCTTTKRFFSLESTNPEDSLAIKLYSYDAGKHNLKKWNFSDCDLANERFSEVHDVRLTATGASTHQLLVLHSPNGVAQISAYSTSGQRQGRLCWQASPCPRGIRPVLLAVHPKQGVGILGKKENSQELVFVFPRQVWRQLKMR